jgi:hypothetical protein
MKKITKPAKTPAPATKPIAPAPALKSTVAPKIKQPAAVSPAAPAIVTKPKASRVTIIAAIDVGFGNSLFVRGDEPTLSWTKGLALGNISESKWEIVLTGVEKPVAFKLLINDGAWSTGENFLASPGDTVTVTPSF